jgi:hypothetical protein
MTGWVMPALSHPSAWKKSAEPPRNAVMALGGDWKNGRFGASLVKDDEARSTR